MQAAVEDIVARVREYLPAVDPALIRRAYDLGRERHGGQQRSSGEPYMVHPIAVAQIIVQMRLDVPSILAAFLHDCVEDTRTSLEEIRAGFGEDVAFLVDGVTKLSKVEYTSREARQAENFRKMLVAMARDIRVLLLKLADRLHNARTLEHLPEDRRQRIARETLDVYAPLANRLGIDWMKGELEDLSFRWLHPEEWAGLVAKVQKSRKERDRFIQEMTRTISEMLHAHDFKVVVSGRHKRLFSVREKMRRQHIEFEQVHDLIGFRVICDTVAECYAILGVIHSQWTPVPGRFKDHIGIPKQNGYQSLHTTVVGPRGLRVEIQIRHHEFHKIAAEGVAADRLFNSISKGSTNYIPDLQKKNEAFLGTKFEISAKLKSPEMVQQATKILTAAGAQVAPEGVQLKASGDLGRVIAASLTDSAELFENRDQALQSKYGFPGKEVVYVWWNFFKEMDKDLKRQSKFKEAAFVGDVV
jgi:GTP pyrophosphokinase